jgi:hypothetical protein
VVTVKGRGGKVSLDEVYQPIRLPRRQAYYVATAKVEAAAHDA